jgi:CTD small phosphatase-like protein 2
VLDLDETLIHFEKAKGQDEEDYYMIRPGAHKFLSDLSCLYEIVVFTAAMPDYANWIMDQIDEQGIVKHRLYRQHCSPHEDYAIKDLRNLGRDISRTIIIDNLKENFEVTTPDNGIWVESWYDDLDDKVLPTLVPFLEQLVISEVPDVRRYLGGQNRVLIQECLETGKTIPSII